MYKKCTLIVLFFIALISSGCADKNKENQPQTKIEKQLLNYADVKLNANLDVLSANQKKMLPYLFEAAKLIDDLYWIQTYGKKEQLFESITDENTLKYININYGPWDRLNGNESFVEGVGKKPDGANFYPADMSYQEFEEFGDLEKYSSYTLLRRNEIGGLQTIPYYKAYDEKLQTIADLMLKAADLAENDDLKTYLQLRAKALITDKYFDSDLAWMKMKDNVVDFIVGPIDENDDRLFWSKTSYQSMVLIKDKDWSKNLEKYALLLPYLQKNLPVDAKYITELPKGLSDIMVYDVIYCTGYWNAGGKRIAFNLPRDGQVQLKVGSRKLQFRNVMEAKFEKILKPMSNLLINPDQHKHVTFNAFFENTMFYEVGSSLGIKETIKKEPVRDALKEYYNVIEESKNDILSLFFITKLYDMGELNSGTLMDNYVTYMADIFRSVRFGISNDQGVANMVRFNYFQDAGAFSYDNKTNTYTIHFEKMKQAMNSLANIILVIQGEGNYEEAKKLITEKGFIRDELLNDLYRVQKERIPKDVVFIQGLLELGLPE
ncbi:MAG: Zn-dependent hydrolase [Bacteroidales bacterium]